MSTEMYDNHCKDAFARIENNLTEAAADRKELKKYLVGNGEEGALDTLRNHKRYFRCVWGVVIFVVALIVTQTAIAWRTHVSEDNSKARILQVLEKIESDEMSAVTP